MPTRGRPDARTDNALPDRLRVADGLELEAVLEPGHAVRAGRGADRDDELVVAAGARSARGRVRVGAHAAYARDVHVLALAAVRGDGLHLEQALGHDEVDGARIDEVAAEARDDLAEGLDEGSDRDGSDRSGCGRAYSQTCRAIKRLACTDKGGAA